MTDDLRRFLVTIPSIPYLEAILLLRSYPGSAWSPEMVAQRLYLGEDQAFSLLQSLCAAAICSAIPDNPSGFYYQPAQELGQLIDSLATLYAQHLIEITNIIHAQSNKHQRIQQFADAFKWRKE